jgi:hypothetical protein
MSSHYISGQNYNIFSNKSAVNVANLKYLETAAKNQNGFREENKTTLNSRNVCCYSVQNNLSFRLPCKNLKVKVIQPTRTF